MSQMITKFISYKDCNLETKNYSRIYSMMYMTPCQAEAHIILHILPLRMPLIFSTRSLHCSSQSYFLA